MSVQQGFPNIGSPLVNAEGRINQTWLQFLISLWNRTGGASGGGVTSIQVIAHNGITESVNSSSTDVTITLGLGNITPSAVISSGPITGSNLSGNNTGNVSVSGQNYLSIAGQAITANPIDLSGSNISNILGIANGGTGQSSANSAFNALAPSQAGNAGKILTTNGTDTSWTGASSGTVTSVSIVTANGVSGSVATATTTPAITLTLGAITPSSVAATGTITGSNLTSDTYTPTLTNVSNIDSSAAGGAQYMRVGNTVTVSGYVNVDATSAGVATALGISLPIASNFSDVSNCAGTAATVSSGERPGAINADTVNHRATLNLIPISTANLTWYYNYTYQII